MGRPETSRNVLLLPVIAVTTREKHAPEGLACAKYLVDAGHKPIVLEARDCLGFLVCTSLHLFALFSSSCCPEEPAAASIWNFLNHNVPELLQQIPRWQGLSLAGQGWRLG